MFSLHVMPKPLKYYEKHICPMDSLHWPIKTIEHTHFQGVPFRLNQMIKTYMFNNCVFAYNWFKDGSRLLEDENE